MRVEHEIIIFSFERKFKGCTQMNKGRSALCCEQMAVYNPVDTSQVIFVPTIFLIACYLVFLAFVCFDDSNGLILICILLC